MGHKPFTKNEDKYIKENYLTITIGNLSKQLGRSYFGVRNAMKRMGLVLPQDILEARKSMCWIKKGSISFNKGKKQTEYMSKEAIARSIPFRFQKQHLPHNVKYDGYEHLTKDGYIEVRVALRKYVLKHKLIWEAANGKIPPKHCIWYKDGNKQNVTLDNLEMISQAENLRRNQESFRSLPPEIQEAQGLINKINRKIKKHGNKKQD